MAVFDIYEIRNQRKLINDNEKNFFLTYENMTVKDNLPLSFTMFGDDYLNCRRDINAKTTKQYYNTNENEKYPTRKLPLDKRWSARKFDFSLT